MCVSIDISVCVYHSYTHVMVYLQMSGLWCLKAFTNNSVAQLILQRILPYRRPEAEIALAFQK